MLVALLAWTGLASAAELAPHYAPAPSWVKLSTPAPAAATPAGGATETLLADSQTLFGADADQFYYESASKVLTPDGLPLGDLAMVWNPDTESLSVNRVTILRDGKVIDVLASQTFTVLRREDNLDQAALDGRLTATLQVQDLRVGDVLDIAATTTRRHAVPGVRSEFDAGFPSTLTGARLQVRALWPANRPMTWRATPDLPPPRLVTQSGLTELTWAFDGLTGTIPTDGAPPRFNVRRAAEFSRFTAWDEVAAATVPLFAEAATLRPDSPLKAEIARIRAAAGDPAGRAMLALKLVQDDVRYVQTGLNGAAYRPAPADQTWSRRFGDAKGKTALLLALLSGLDIPAEPALVSVTGNDGLDQRLPRLQVFDHVLVRAVVDGRPLWLDGAGSGDRDPEELRTLPYGWALPVRARGGALERLEQAVPTTPSMEVVIFVDARAGTDAPAQVTIERLYRGDAAVSFHRDVAEMTREAAEQGLKTKFSQDYDWVTPVTVDWSFEEASRTMRTTLHGTGKGDWFENQTGGPTTARYFEIDNSSFGELDAYERPADQDKSAPFVVDFPYFVRTTTVVRLPRDGWTYGLAGNDLRQTLGGYARARTTRLTDGDLVVMTRSVRALSPEISAAEAARSEAVRKSFNTRPVYISADQPAPAFKRPDLSQVTDPKALEEALRQAARAQDPEAAVAALDRLAVVDPKSPPRLLVRARFLRQAHRDAEAAQTLAAAIQAAGPSAEEILYSERALALIAAGDRDGALARYAEAIQRFPASAPLRGARARLLLDAQDPKAALAEADAGLALAPGDDQALDARAIALRRLGRPADALSVYDRLIAAAPDWTYYRWMHGGAQLALKRYERARADFQEALAIDPQFFPAAISLADTDRRLHLNAEALATLDRAIDLTPKSPDLFNSRCWHRAITGGALDLAQADCDAALAIAPRNPAVLDSRAFVSLKQGRFKDAVTRYDAALAVRPDQAASIYGRGVARLRLGDTSGGRADLAAATKIQADIAADFVGYGVTLP